MTSMFSLGHSACQTVSKLSVFMDVAPTPRSVIPAKAGIQEGWGGELLPFASPHPWIPAFAGMTDRGVGASSYPSYPSGVLTQPGKRE